MQLVCCWDAGCHSERLQVTPVTSTTSDGWVETNLEAMPVSLLHVLRVSIQFAWETTVEAVASEGGAVDELIIDQSTASYESRCCRSWKWSASCRASWSRPSGPGCAPACQSPAQGETVSLTHLQSNWNCTTERASTYHRVLRLWVKLSGVGVWAQGKNNRHQVQVLQYCSMMSFYMIVKVVNFKYFSYLKIFRT